MLEQQPRSVCVELQPALNHLLADLYENDPVIFADFSSTSDIKSGRYELVVSPGKSDNWKVLKVAVMWLSDCVSSAGPLCCCCWDCWVSSYQFEL